MDEAPRRSPWLDQDMIYLLAATDKGFMYLDVIGGHILEVWQLTHLTRDVLLRTRALATAVLQGGGLNQTKVRFSLTPRGGVQVQVFDPYISAVPAGAEDDHYVVQDGPGVIRWFTLGEPEPAPRHGS